MKEQPTKTTIAVLVSAELIERLGEFYPYIKTSAQRVNTAISDYLTIAHKRGVAAAGCSAEPRMGQANDAD